MLASLRLAKLNRGIECEICTHPPPSAAIWPLAWREGMKNERCLHSAHSPPPLRQRPEARLHGQRYVKYIGPYSPRRLTATSPTRDAADGRQRRPTSPPTDAPLQVAENRKLFDTFVPAVIWPRLPPCCFHLRSYWSFPLIAPVVTLFLPFDSPDPLLVLAQRFPAPFGLSSLSSSCRVVSSAVSS